MDVAAVLSDRMVHHVELLVPYHFDVDHISKRMPTQEECSQMGDLLGEIIENDGVDGAPEHAPYLREGEGH